MLRHTHLHCVESAPAVTTLEAAVFYHKQLDDERKDIPVQAGEEVEVQLQAFLNEALGESNRSASRSVRFRPDKKFPSGLSMGLVGFKTGLYRYLL